MRATALVQSPVFFYICEHVKPFLILQLRPEDLATQNEFDAILKFGNLSRDEVIQIRMEQQGIPALNLDDYSAVIVGGGPSNVSDPIDKKSDAQKRFEPELNRLLSEIVKKDFPYLGLCYGLGALTVNQGSIMSKEKYAEGAGAVDITLREGAEIDPLLAGVPKTFRAFVGHKESCQNLPKDAVWLASSEQCPYHIYRLKQNIYALQFHPEMDVEGICVRTDIYKNEGYFPPGAAEEIKATCRTETVTEPMKILKNFVEWYRRQ